MIADLKLVEQVTATLIAFRCENASNTRKVMSLGHSNNKRTGTEEFAYWNEIHSIFKGLMKLESSEENKRIKAANAWHARPSLPSGESRQIQAHTSLMEALAACLTARSSRPLTPAWRRQRTFSWDPPPASPPPPQNTQDGLVDELSGKETDEKSKDLPVERSSSKEASIGLSEGRQSTESSTTDMTTSPKAKSGSITQATDGLTKVESQEVSSESKMIARVSFAAVNVEILDDEMMNHLTSATGQRASRGMTVSGPAPILDTSYSFLEEEASELFSPVTVKNDESDDDNSEITMLS